MTAAAIALLSLVLAGKDQGRRVAGHCRTGMPVCAALLLLPGCNDAPAEKGKAVPDRSALAGGGSAFVIRVDPVEGKEVHAEALAKAGAIIEKRLNPDGRKDVMVTPMGGNKVMVEVAGLTVEEAEAAKPLLQKSARLEFRLLGPEERTTTTEEDTAIRPGYSRMRYLDESGEEKERIAAMTPAERRARPKPDKFMWVKNKAELSGKSISYAGATQSPGAKYYSIMVELHKEFGDKMLEVTTANIGKPMAIIVDGEILSAPTIQGKFGSNFMITGNFTEAEAIELSNQLMNPLENPLIVEKITAIPPAAGKK